MNVQAVPITLHRRRAGPRLQRLGDALRRRRRAVAAVQWAIVAVYAVLVVVPVFLPPPPAGATLWNNLTLAAQFAFWGVWWPCVIASVVLFGRFWCGLLCPEGTLTEFASRHGLGRSIPRWLRWSGWPPLAFVATTVWGQLISVYEYPRATLLILGGSTLAAVGVGFVYGRGKRVWCRYLCPVSGVFALLARLAPLHYRADAEAWRRHDGPRERVDCAPLLDLRHLDAAADCHACGRCSGHRGAIALAARRPASEVVSRTAPPPTTPAALLLLAGIFGIALGAFQWSASPTFVAVRQAAATWLVEHDVAWLLRDDAPWWLLTHEPRHNDVFLWLDAFAILGHLAATTLVVGGGAWLALAAAARLLDSAEAAWPRLASALLPCAGASLFVGLSQTTLAQLRAEGIQLPAVQAVRVVLIGGAALWSIVLGWQLAAQSGRSLARRMAACALMLVPIGLVGLSWWRHFHGAL